MNLEPLTPIGSDRERPARGGDRVISLQAGVF